jgi:hypothetical protein
MSGFAASQDGPQSLSENSARPNLASERRIAKAKVRRALRKGIVSGEAAERHVPGLVIVIGRPHHDYDRTGMLKDDTIEGSTA